MSRALRCARAAAILLAVVACGRGPATHYYLLTLPSPVEPSSERGGGLTIGIRPFLVDAPYDQDRIVYRFGERSPEVGFYEYHVWAAPLAERLPLLVGQHLSRTAGVVRAEPVKLGRDYDVYLAGRLQALEEIDFPGRQTVRVELVLTLSRSEGEAIWEGEASGHSTTDTDEVADIVRHMGIALDRALDTVAGELSRALAG